MIASVFHMCMHASEHMDMWQSLDQDWVWVPNVLNDNLELLISCFHFPKAGIIGMHHHT